MFPLNKTSLLKVAQSYLNHYKPLNLSIVKLKQTKKKTYLTQGIVSDLILRPLER